jgi:2-hydroxychromene-2-carboxylate isomerase
VWRPFLLGPIFAAQGWTTSPFNLYPEKGRYMWRDLEREAAKLTLPFCRPETFPQNSLLAEQGWIAPYTKAVFQAEFGKGRNISDPALIAGILADLGADADAVLGEAQGDANKARLRRVGEEAQARGIFGAPSFVADDREVFWGNDRLERALEWAVAHGRRSDWPV